MIELDVKKEQVMQEIIEKIEQRKYLISKDVKG